ncbi:GntP family permease [Salisediminibacterium halotolerans]|uniref:H+/gluconate symporter n=1 Tax=Salisediminibacterium halotolerans TaxID=517425 RepID=A0A1H9REV9_9BACI|nr:MULTISPECIES: GntP family permease [Salisediminibacterium]RLJ78328.1 H+/gluconate symporter-like permease [Actinophytocola xinjiangensis]RPE88333.1 H+/gluconate symporter-like permease [Salisediminibacterium halotolerans]TWG37304.1 H+/gluconate symporter-like permease [Salisediminibacterium halotolerans]SER71222.1 H+/gluconate symporter [Salisediminibacterium haloalkalitolerans]GEL09138.1 citrate transporter [Salisediminibacterium halotolerans]
MFGIVLGLLVIMVLAYMGWSIIWVAPIAAGVVALTGGLDLLEAYRFTYMDGFVGFAKEWFPVFMLGAIFGKLMEDTGMARSVASGLIKVIGTERAILGVLVSAAVLTYGGISLFVVVFAVYPLALALFREANVTRRLLPPTIALGAFTFTMTAIPGTPQIQNLIPTGYYGTNAMAAPFMGLSAAAVMAFGGYFYLRWREKKLTAKGEVFTEPKDKKTTRDEDDGVKLPNIWLSFVPLILVVATLNILGWDIVVALITGILSIMLFNLEKIKGFVKAINAGANGSVIAIVNTSAAVGFGTVVQAVPGFERLSQLVMDVPGNPLISQAVAINVLAGSTGSASGGLGITLEALGAQYLEISQMTGIPAEAFHRVASIASGGLDVLPHNGAVLTLLAVTGMTHKDCYKDIFIVGAVIPVISVFVAILVSTFGVL